MERLLEVLTGLLPFVAGLFLPVLVGFVASILGALAVRFNSRLNRGREAQKVETLEQRVERLTTALSSSTRVVEEIEEEIHRRQDLAEQLRQDVTIYERLRDMDREEVEAVAQVLGGELRREGRRSFWINFATNCGFFLLGVVTSVITTLIIG